MEERVTLAGLIRFGPFALDAESSELRKGLTRLKVPYQSIEILKALLEQPGHLVTREELRERLWSSDTFVDFDAGLNAAIKRLRDALGDVADAPRFIETLPRRGYRFIGPLDGSAASVPTSGAPVADTAQPPQWTSPANANTPWLKRRRVAVLSSGALVFVAVLIVVMSRPRPHRINPQLTPKRLTFDGGLQTDPALSPDGSSIAYASNKGGQFDIWMQPVAGGNPVRVTTHPSHDWQPDWSPDRSQIVFRSERDGGGLFIVPCTGGREIRVATFGYRPRWSPNGSRILFTGVALGNAGHGPIYTVGLDGDTPKLVETQGLSEQERGDAAVGWHTVSGSITYAFASVSGDEFSVANVDASGGKTAHFSVHQGVRDGFRDERLRIMSGQPIVWAHDGDGFYFVGRSRGLLNIWSVDVDPRTLTITGGPRRITTTTESNESVTISRDGNRLAFGAADRNPRVVLYPLSGDGRQIAGAPEALTSQELRAYSPDVTRDGSRIAFRTQRPGSGSGLIELHVKANGVDKVPVVDDYWGKRELRTWPRLAPDGRHIVYGFARRARSASRSAPDIVRSLMLLDVESGREEELTTPFSDDAFDDELAYGWSPNGQDVVAVSGRYRLGQNTIALIPIARAPTAEKVASPIFSSVDYGLADASVSPDGRWVCFTASKRGVSRLAIARVGQGSSTWLSDESVWNGKPKWSPDGRMIYFISRKGGMFNVWGLSIDLDRGKPVGEPFQITSFDGSGDEIMPEMGLADLGVGRGRIVLPIVHPRGGVWIIENLSVR